MHSFDNIASRLNKRITLQQPVTNSDGAGGATIVWQDVVTIWAHIEPLRSEEIFTHDKLAVHSLYRVFTRYRSDIIANKRIIYAGRVFLILGIVNVEEKNTLLEMRAREEL